MPNLPTIAKTWEIDANRAIGQATEAATIAEWFFSTVSWLTDPARTTPCIVRGSSDGVDIDSGMDGVNRITSQAAASEYGVNHSWVVLEFPGIHFLDATGNPEPNPLQVLISRADTIVGEIQIIISMAQGFGIANGGSDDGSFARNPNSLDQWSSFYGQSLIGAGNLPDMRQTTWLSSDGSICRMLISGVTTARARFLSFETPKNPIPSWERPFMFCALGHTTTASVTVDHDAWNSQGASQQLSHIAFAPYRDMRGIGVRDWSTVAAPSLEQVTSFALVHGRSHVGAGSSVTFVESYPAAHAIDGGYPITDLSLYVENNRPAVYYLGSMGFWGQFEDLYLIGGGAKNDALPSTGEKTWWHGGTAIMPGLNDSLTDIIL